jgi:hypothetical protein
MVVSSFGSPGSQREGVEQVIDASIAIRKSVDLDTRLV